MPAQDKTVKKAMLSSTARDLTGKCEAAFAGVGRGGAGDARIDNTGTPIMRPIAKNKKANYLIIK